MTSQIGLQLSAQNLQRRAFSDTVGSHQSKNLARSRGRQPMELEAVGAIAMGNLTLEIGGQVDDRDGVERTLLGADTTTDAERLRDKG